MIYPANFEQKIGFDRLREQVAALCTMRAARGKLASETFSASAREIGRRLELADQMRLLLDMEHDFPGGEYPEGQRTNHQRYHRRNAYRYQLLGNRHASAPFR